MLKNLTYKIKINILIASAILLFLFLYKFVFGNTVELITENIELKERIETGKGIEGQLKIYNSKLSTFESAMDSYLVDSVKNREFILHMVSDFCHNNNLTLKEFPQVVVETNIGYQIETNKVIAEGDFFNLLKLLYEVERVNKISRPASASFEKKYDNKLKKEYLLLTVYLQNFRKNAIQDK